MDKKEIVRRGVMVGVLFVLIISTVLAWFVYNKQNSGDAPKLNVVGISDISSVLYHQIYDGDTLVSEEQVTSILISNYIPGQIERYRLQLSNNGVATTAAVSLVNVNADFTVEENAPQPDIEVAKVINLQDVYTTITTGSTPIIDPRIVKGAEGLSLYNAYFKPADVANRNIDLVQNIALKENNTESIYFSFKLIPQANNYYQYKSLQIDKINVIS